MSDLVMWLIVGAVVLLVTCGLLLFARSRKRRQSGSTIGLPDLGAVSADLDKEQVGAQAPDAQHQPTTASPSDQRPQ